MVTYATTPPRITVVEATACHFCEDALAALDELREEFPLTVTRVAADSGDGEEIIRSTRAGMFPVVLVDGAYFSQGRLPRRKLRKLLQARPQPIGA